ncbi:hypothetical protein OSB04_020343 [Centaurea solstitialis]|uniref:Integrase catalytic domain-containing protein n=1 Tax=Centaurea solstitialis TaxID=347529 RepID=A0AA38SS17_9ASTR|nr:hypothetical protein OSB04_020343 [Centaurea solstitialis]
MSPYPAGFITKQPSQHPSVCTADLTPKVVLFSGNFSTDTVQLPDVLNQRQSRFLEKVVELDGYLKSSISAYPLNPLSYTNLTASVSKIPSFDLWHARLGHLSSAIIQLLANSGLLGNITSNEVSCFSCKLGKHHALLYKLNDYKSASAFDLIHSDVWRPAPHPSIGGLTTSDLYYLCPYDTNPILTIKILRADNAMEYKESFLITFLRSQGTIPQYSCPGTSPQNGCVERKYRHILDTIRTLLISAKCPIRFWGEAAFTAVYTINQHPIPTLQNKSPYEALYGITPAYELLKVWGCACFVQLQPHEHTKLQPRFRLCLFIDLPSLIPTNFKAPTHVASPVLSTHIPPPPGSPDPVPILPTQPSATMQEELQALAKAQTWDSVLFLLEKDPSALNGSSRSRQSQTVPLIGTKPVLSQKASVRSFSQEYAIAAMKHWPLFQIDVKNTFLNGDLSEEVYMTPPPGVSLPPGHVCRLCKALYGVKQAPRDWFEKFSNTVLSLGFSASNYDSGLVTRTTDSCTILLLLYVDDMIIRGSDTTGITHLKQSLSSSFEMKDLGLLHYFLGLKVLSNTAGTYLCQPKYTSDLLSRASITDNKVTSTPLEHNVHLAPNADPPLRDPTLYHQLVGSLFYLTVTRPEIAYAVHTVSQFMTIPCSDHYAIVLRILRYLKGTMFHGVYFSSTSSLILRGFSDADWDSDMTDRHSTIGTEAEYRALADTSQELIWLCWLLSDIGIPQQSPTLLWCDKTSAIQIAHNDVFHERTKHIKINCHFIRQHVVLKTIQLQPISIDDQPPTSSPKLIFQDGFGNLFPNSTWAILTPIEFEGEPTRPTPRMQPVQRSRPRTMGAGSRGTEGASRSSVLRVDKRGTPGRVVGASVSRMLLFSTMMKPVQVDPTDHHFHHCFKDALHTFQLEGMVLHHHHCPLSLVTPSLLEHPLGDLSDDSSSSKAKESDNGPEDALVVRPPRLSPRLRQMTNQKNHQILLSPVMEIEELEEGEDGGKEKESESDVAGEKLK